MTTTDRFDAFEQRLVAAMATEAETVVEPDDGLDRIHGRVAHRRRTRRATWLAAAAALVLVAGTVGILLRSSSTDSAPYVGTDSTAEMPLLGFDGDTWTVSSYTPGGGYVVSPDRSGSSPDGFVLNVTRTDTGYPNPNVVVAATGEEVIGGRTLTTAIATAVDSRGYEVFRSPALVWEPAPGYRAMVVGNSSLPPESITGMRSLVARVIDVDRPTWERHIRSAAPDPRPVSGQPMLVLTGSAGSTQLLSVSGDAVLARLSFTRQSSVAQLARLTNGMVVDQTNTTPVAVREVEGRFIEGSSESLSQLSWREEGEAYLLSVPWGTSAESAAALADELVRARPSQWEALLYPAEPVDMSLLTGGGMSSGP